MYLFYFQSLKVHSIPKLRKTLILEPSSRQYLTKLKQEEDWVIKKCFVQVTNQDYQQKCFYSNKFPTKAFPIMLMKQVYKLLQFTILFLIQFLQCSFQAVGLSTCTDVLKIAYKEIMCIKFLKLFENFTNHKTFKVCERSLFYFSLHAHRNKFLKLLSHTSE